MSNRQDIILFATQGTGGNDEERARELLGAFAPEVFPFDWGHKVRSFWRAFRLLRTRRPALVLMEGTGLAGGAALLLGRCLAGVPYIVSSGDAVGPWVGGRYPLLGPIFGLYERILCRWSAGFIGWTPYLAGRALTFGAPRAMTAAGWAPFVQSAHQRSEARARVRVKLGLPSDALVAGIAGSIIWNSRLRYCYASELVRAAQQVCRPDVHILVVGDGTGRPYLEELAGPRLGRTIHFTGRVPQQEVPDYLAAMDVGSLPQSVDGTGNFRYTTKISEYLAARLPVVTGQIPMAYDLDEGWLWRLPGPAPWSPRYVRALADFFENLTPDDLAAKRSAVPSAPAEFDRARQIRRATDFVRDILDNNTVS